MQPENVVEGLKTYSGRDACIRVIAYLGLFLYGVIDLAVKHLSSKEHKDEETPYYFYLFTLVSIEQLIEIGKSCRVIQKQFATTRLVTRFFDDIPAIFSLFDFMNTAYPDEPNETEQKPGKALLNGLSAINLLFWVLYNPFEHIGDLKVIDVDHNAFYDYTNVCWAGALATSVLLNLRVALVYYFQQLNKAKIEETPNFDRSQLVSPVDMRKSVFIAFRDFLDLCMALSYFPAGWLPWEGRFIHYQIGLLGVVSSLLRIKQYILK